MSRNWRLTKILVSILAGLAIALTINTPAGQAFQGSGNLRIDPEALSGRISQYLLGEGEFSTAKAPGGVTFGANIQISDEHFTRRLISQTEPTIAASHMDGNILVAGFHDLYPNINDFVCRIAFTSDGGQTWNLGGATPLQAEGNFCSDPALAADGDGNFYYAYLDVNFGATSSDVVVAKSTDGGQTFPTFSVAAEGNPSTNFPDKEFIAVDHHHDSPFHGNVYVSWTDFLNPLDPQASDNGQIKVVVSRDGGLSWSEPAAISHSAQFPEAISGSLPVVAHDGTVYIFFADFIAGTGPLSIRFSKSTDGGESWNGPFDIAANLPSPGRFMLKNAEPGFGSIPGAGFRSNSFPTAAVSHEGALYVAWVDFPDGSCTPDGTGRPPCINADVRLVTSTDGGATWSTPKKVSDEKNASDQFFPWVAIHHDLPVSIIWQDKRLDANNINFDTFYTSSANGKTFRRNERISSATSQTGLTRFIGDYNYLAVTDTGIFPVWTDRRLGNNDIFTVTGLAP